MEVSKTKKHSSLMIPSQGSGNKGIH